MFEVKTIPNFWGGKKCVDANNVIKHKKLYNKNNPSLFTAHGTNDLIVTCEKGEALKKIYEATVALHVLYLLKEKDMGCGITVKMKIV